MAHPIYRSSSFPTLRHQTYRTFERMTTFCKTRVPQEMWDQLLPIKDDDEAVKNWGIDYMTKLCRCVRPFVAPL